MRVKMSVQLIQSVRRNYSDEKQHEMKDVKMKTVKLVNTEQVVLTHSPILSISQTGGPSDVERTSQGRELRFAERLVNCSK